MVSIPICSATVAQQALQAVRAIQRMRRDPLEFGSDASFADQMVGMRDHAVLWIHVGAVIRRRLDIDDFAFGVPDQEVRRTAAIRLHHRQQSLVEGPGIQDFRQRTWNGLRNPLAPSRRVTRPLTHKPMPAAFTPILQPAMPASVKPTKSGLPFPGSDERLTRMTKT